jgi:hypothetical protein
MGLQFQWVPLNRRCDAAKKVLCTSSNVPFFIDRSQPNLYQLWRMRSKWYVYSFSEFPWIEGVMLRRRYFVQPIKCPLLLTDRNQIYTNCGTCSVNDRFTVSVRSIEKRRNAPKKVLSTTTKVTFLLTDHKQNYTNYGACGVSDMFTVSVRSLE